MRVDRQEFFEKNWIPYNDDTLAKYNDGWTFSELKRGEEFIVEEYQKQHKNYFNLQNTNFH